MAQLLTKLWRDRRAQDLIEYALMAGFVAVAAAVVFPRTIAPNIKLIFTQVHTVLVKSIS